MNDLASAVPVLDANPPQHVNGMEIAIVGLAGRFPGAADVAQFWRNLRDGVCAIRCLSDEALRERGVSAAQWQDPEFVRAVAELEGLDQFDAGFFGYTPGDAAQLDPQQRLFLEVAWQALSHAGYAPHSAPVATGVFAGSGASLYLMRHLLPGVDLHNGRDIASLIGLMNANDKDALASRVAYKLGLRGPAVSVQTACSTSLVAVHLACRSLLDFDTDMALAGGVSLNLLQQAGYFYQPGAILSPDGYCRAFDARAGGTVVGSGAGVVVLKRLDDALADGDTVHAVIKSSAINNDGADKIGYTAPSVQGQADVIRAAHALADIDPRSISYLEAHGTGTMLGDPVEVAALTQAFRAHTDDTGFCALGSVKTNVGHLDAAAGVTGLIKTVLMLRHRTLVPSLHFQAPNPQIDFAGSPFVVSTATRDWPAGDTPRRAGVSSFGMGGTNAHLLLEEAPAVPQPAPQKQWRLFPLSARSDTARQHSIDALAADLATQSAADVAHTLAHGRAAFERRAVALAEDIEGLRTALNKDSLLRGRVLSDAPSVAFLFPGQGAQHPGMCETLYRDEAVFRDTLNDCCDRIQSLTGTDLRPLLYPPAAHHDAAAEKLSHTLLTQPALFSVCYALARFWQSRGVEPDAMLGHSIGEYVAACLAGVFSLDDALRVVCARGRLLQDTAPGAMLAIQLDQAALSPWLADTGCDLAAVNAGDRCVAAGPVPAIENLAQALAQEQVPVQRLHVSHAFHSAQVESMLPAFRDVLANVTLQPPAIPFVSNVTGTWITPAQATSVDYWLQHVRGTVRFADGLTALLEKTDRVLLECGPGDTLMSLARQHPAQAGRPLLASQCHPRRQQDNPLQPLRCLAQLWIAGLPVLPVWREEDNARRIPLPGYPFERRRYWVDAAPGKHTVQDDGLAVPFWQRADEMVEKPAPRRVALFGEASALRDALASVLNDAGHSVTEPEQADVVVLLPSAAPHTEWLSLLPRLSGDCLLCAVTEGIFDVTGTEPLHPEQAVMLGLCNVVPQEYPALRCRLIDIQRDGLPPALLAREILASGKESPVALRGQHRWLRSLQPLPAHGDASRLRRGGVYLITGGNGGVGQVLARYLAHSWQAKVALLSRQAQRVDAGMLAVQADVTDAASLDAAVRAVQQEFGDIHGVIHAAGLPGDGALDSLTPEKMAQVMAPKVSGTRHLIGALQRSGQSMPDFVLLCSSLASFTAGSGKGAYAAANACQDALSAALRRDTGYPVCAVNWDGWRAIGMAAGLALPDGIGLTAEQGSAALARLLSGPVRAQVLVSNQPLSRRLRADADALLDALGDDTAPPGEHQPRPALDTPYVAPDTDTARRLADIWQDVLGMAPIGLHDNLFELGGDSLLAVRMLARVRTALQVTVPPTVFFRDPTLAGLVSALGGQDDTPQQPITPVDRRGALPLAPVQQRLWLVDRLAGPADRSAYNLPAMLSLTGELSAEKLADSLNALLRRHESLRTVYPENGHGDAVAHILPSLTLTLTQTDLTPLCGTAQARELDALYRRVAETPFDLAKGPLLRAHLVTLAPRAYRLILAIHHIVFDGWSAAVFVRELSALYASLRDGTDAGLPVLGVQYVDYAHWHHTRLAKSRDTDLAFWRGYLDKAPPLSTVPPDHARPPVASQAGDALRFTLDGTQRDALASLARAQGTTLFTVLLAAFAIVLHRHTDAADLVIGTDVAGRPDPALDHLIGFFVNVVPIRARLAQAAQPFSDYLAGLREQVLRAFDHQELPFDQLVEALGIPRERSRNPLVQVLFVLQNTPPLRFALPGLEVAVVPQPRTESKFDLAVFVNEEDDGLRVEWVYATALYERTTQQALSDAWRTVLTAVAATPQASVETLYTPPQGRETVMRDTRTLNKLDKLSKLGNLPGKARPAGPVRQAPLQAARPFPLLVEARDPDLDPFAWAAAQRASLHAALCRHGGILFRGFALGTPQEFERFAEIIEPALYGSYGDLPKKEGGRNTYRSTPYPEKQMILYHNESAHLEKWPRKQLFFCEQPSPVGGATPIVDCREMLTRLPPEIVREFEQRGLLYVRTFTRNLDVSWRDFYKTDNRAEVEQRLRDAGIDWQWLGDDELQTRTRCPAVIRHPETGERVFFNQVQLHHAACLEDGVRDDLIATVGEARLPRNVLYGDGDVIPDEVMAIVGDAYEACAVRFDWQRGDVVLLDNMLAAHARDPYEGPRRIVVAMGDMFARADLS
ncbi:erythronolide synthase [Isoalcanivorax pacificus W11-5]|uniref:Phenolphthiocerol/phthiocerol polyketide synthase subunit E n=1 Tax=Isoalcanivorax pacificus W11-5 TaxID=391936 RepID=A0A0B4XMD0_9GAMM|nr:type I polyketide synthase [Isoalcanivorax pacificus]AJD47482.1 erythronolide synthase [Isoalcanivorax pacificus W11-5]